MKPNDLVLIVYLLANKIAPAHKGLELGIGDSLISKACAKAFGTTAKQIEEDEEVMCMDTVKYEKGKNRDRETWALLQKHVNHPNPRCLNPNHELSPRFLIHFSSLPRSIRPWGSTFRYCQILDDNGYGCQWIEFLTKSN
ncbi:hypothetical protein LguiB_031407 [Lonicera macranthoides]